MVRTGHAFHWGGGASGVEDAGGRGPLCGRLSARVAEGLRLGDDGLEDGRELGRDGGDVGRGLGRHGDAQEDRLADAECDVAEGGKVRGRRICGRGGSPTPRLAAPTEP